MLENDEFERAVEAVINGDTELLGRLLASNTKLARTRSVRQHRATLLHYVSANGVEDERQKSPANSVAIAQMLIEAGSDVDSVLADGASTTLSLVSSSVHPERAGVQTGLIELLVKEGAKTAQPLLSAVQNGHLSAAETLVRLGAKLDNIVVAAAFGRLDVIRHSWNEAFIYACEYGRTEVAKYLLEHGADPAAGSTIAQTGMHYAAHAGHLDTIEMLIAQGVPLESKNVYGGTVLGQAQWSAENEPKPDHPAIIQALMAAGAKT